MLESLILAAGLGVVPTPYEMALAESLLAAPAGVVEEFPADESRRSRLGEAVRRIAVRDELLDPRECSYFLVTPEAFQADLDILRVRRASLAGAPLVGDANRLPNRDAVNNLATFNRAFRRHLENRLVWEAERSDLFGSVLEETDRLYRVWDAVRDARCEFYYVTVRRDALARLVRLIGADAYERMELPPHVPGWRFGEALR